MGTQQSRKAYENLQQQQKDKTTWKPRNTKQSNVDRTQNPKPMTASDNRFRVVGAVREAQRGTSTPLLLLLSFSSPRKLPIKTNCSNKKVMKAPATG
jgi:hypothetical protein